MRRNQLPAALLTFAAACASAPHYVIEPVATTPPSPGYPVYVWVPQWVRPSLLCVVDRKPRAPVYEAGQWSCPLPMGKRQ